MTDSCDVSPVVRFFKRLAFSLLKLTLPNAKKRKQTRWLARHGQRIQAKVAKVYVDRELHRRKQNAWRILCQWQHPHTTVIYCFTSEPLVFDPSAHLGNYEIEVLIDPKNPRVYLMDVSPIAQRSRTRRLA